MISFFFCFDLFQIWTRKVGCFSILVNVSLMQLDASKLSQSENPSERGRFTFSLIPRFNRLYPDKHNNLVAQKWTRRTDLSMPENGEANLNNNL